MSEQKIESTDESVKESTENIAAKGGAVPNEERNAGGIPTGVVPLFLSAAGQQIFACVVEKDVTADSPKKLIEKKTILEDFRNRAAVSDFHPVKKKIQDYPGDEVLIVYDFDYKYGQNFCVYVTEEAKELFLKLQEQEAVENGEEEMEVEEEDELPSTPEPRKWECLGSDLDIIDGYFMKERGLIKYSFSRKRRFFGSPCSFTSSLTSSHPENCIDVAPQDGSKFELQRMEMDVGVQAVVEQKEVHSQMGPPKPFSKALQYYPRELDEAEKQEVLHQQSLKDFLDNVYPRLEIYLQQNMIMNIFEDDYMLLYSSDDIIRSKADTNLKEYQSFADLRFSKSKVVTAIEWHPTIKGIIAVSCGENVQYDDRMDLSSTLLKDRSLVLIWSFADPIHPVLFLEGPETIQCFKFNPTNPHLIVGGCVNGQIVMWNIEEHQDLLQVNRNVESLASKALAATMAIFNTEVKLDHAPMMLNCVTTSIKDGHSREVMDLHWLPHSIEICRKTGGVLDNPSHECNQIISCSIDGYVLVWDIRPSLESQRSKINLNGMLGNGTDVLYTYLNLVWTPFIRVPLPRIGMPGKYLATRISINEKHSSLPKEFLDKARNSSPAMKGELQEDANSMFFVGTENGEVAYCDWKPTRDSESGKLIATQPFYAFSNHYGSISCVERSPFYRDIVLTVDNCLWNLWKEGAKSGSLLSSFNSPIPFTGGAWSPTRPGVFFIIKHNGNVDVWDMMDRSHEAVLSQNISSYPLTCIVTWKLTSKQIMLAIGDSSGTLHILETPWNMNLPSNNEVSIMKNFFQHEVEHLEFTTERMERCAVEKESLELTKIETAAKEERPLLDTWDDIAKTDYGNYLSMELKLLTKLGIMEPPSDLND